MAAARFLPLLFVSLSLGLGQAVMDIRMSLAKGGFVIPKDLKDRLTIIARSCMQRICIFEIEQNIHRRELKLDRVDKIIRSVSSSYRTFEYYQEHREKVEKHTLEDFAVR